MNNSAIVPTGWIHTTIGDVYQVVGGGTPSTARQEYWKGTIPWITSADIQGVRDIKISRYITKQAIENSTTNRVPSETLLVVTRVGLGKIAIAQGDICFSQDLQGLIASPELILPQFGLHYLSFALQALKYEGRGTTISGITKKQLKDTTFPLPPLNEQKRIVAKIEELFSEVDKGIENLKTAREQLKIYRQAVLKHAFEGKLTANWREGNRGKLEEGKKLRTRILHKRRKEWELSEYENYKSKGKLPISDKWKFRYREPMSIDITGLPRLPQEWQWVSLDELVSGKARSMQSGPFGSNLKHSEFKQTGMLVIGIDNVGDGLFLRGDQNRISENKFKELQKYQARPGDLLVTVMASLGRTCVLPEDLEAAIITKHVYRITMEKEFLLPDFYNLVLQSETVSRKRMFENSLGQTRPGLNSSILKALPLPLCDGSEQREIVSRLQPTLDQIATTETGIESELQRSELLRQSILKKAFSGRLVRQNPKDEPASVLLERIKAGKSESPKRKKKAA